MIVARSRTLSRGLRTGRQLALPPDAHRGIAGLCNPQLSRGYVVFDEKHVVRIDVGSGWGQPPTPFFWEGREIDQDAIGVQNTARDW